MEELTLEQKQELIDQVMENNPDVKVTALATMALLEAISNKVAECKEIIDQYKKTYPGVMSGGVVIIMAAGLFSTASEDAEGMLPVELVEGYRGAAKNMVNKLKEDVEE